MPTPALPILGFLFRTLLSHGGNQSSEMASRRPRMRPRAWWIDPPHALTLPDRPAGLPGRRAWSRCRWAVRNRNPVGSWSGLPSLRSARMPLGDSGAGQEGIQGTLGLVEPGDEPQEPLVRDPAADGLEASLDRQDTCMLERRVLYNSQCCRSSCSSAGSPSSVFAVVVGFRSRFRCVPGISRFLVGVAPAESGIRFGKIQAGSGDD